MKVQKAVFNDNEQSLLHEHLCEESRVCIQVTGPVLACALSDDCRHLLAAIGNGYVFRYEYRRPKPVGANAARDPKDKVMSDDSTPE